MSFNLVIFFNYEKKWITEGLLPSQATFSSAVALAVTWQPMGIQIYILAGTVATKLKKNYKDSSPYQIT